MSDKLMLFSDLKTVPPEKLFILVDGSSYLFRAYYAPNLHTLKSPTGEPSGVIYGVLMMLKRLVLMLNATPLMKACFVMDEKGGSFRNTLYPPYKANRGTAPEDLVAQIAPLREIIADQGWPVLSLSGFEADDLIATLVVQAKAEGRIAVIVTGDKDLAQLVDDQVFLLDTMKDEWLNAAGVEDKFGVPPNRMIDYLSLIGDTSDNVPGVEKVGPKTARKWLKTYGTLDQVIEHADDIAGVVGQNLRQAREWLPMARQLITLKHDVPLELEPTDYQLQPEKQEALRGWYQYYGFKKMLADLSLSGTNIDPNIEPNKSHASDGASPLIAENALSEAMPHQPGNASGVPTTPLVFLDDKAFETISNLQTLNRWLEKIAHVNLIAIDTETTGLNPHHHKLVGISLAINGQEAAYIPLHHDYPGCPDQIPIHEALNALRPFLENKKLQKTGHNLRFDRHVFKAVGIALQGITEDTVLASLILDGGMRHDLDAVAARWLSVQTIHFEEIMTTSHHSKNFAGVPIVQATRYAAEDAAVAWLLTQEAQKRFADREDEKRRYQLELAVSDVLYHMEHTGIAIEVALLKAFSAELTQRCTQLANEAYQCVGSEFNLSSPKQLQEILFTRMGIKPVKKTKKGASSTNEAVLEQLALDYPIAKIILEHRQLTKLNNTYADKLPGNIHPQSGRIHTHYSQVGVITGRLASSEPNLQNIPIKTADGRRIREAFIPRSGWKMLSADYSQIELRVMAHCANDERMLAAFCEGADIHCRTAADIFHLHESEVTQEQRRYAKTINFGLIYGMSAFGLSRALGIDRASAQQFIDRYFSRYPSIAHFMVQCQEQAEKQGYITTLLGRRIVIQGADSRNQVQKQAAGRFAINAPIQGSAAELIKIAMVEIHHEMMSQKQQSRLLLQVHDELVFEVPQEEIESLTHALSSIMKKPGQILGINLNLRLPLEVNIGIGNNWEEAH